MKKKIIAITLCVALLAIAVVSGTLAYFTDTDSASNTLTSGNVDITLDEAKVEKADDANEYVATNERVQTNDYDNLYPGQQLPKDPTVTNVGTQDAYVRVKVAFPSVGNSWQESFASVGLLLGIDSDNFVMGDPDTYNLEALFEDFDPTLWKVEQTEYTMPIFGGNNLVLTFTYNEILEPGDSAVLFTAVNIDPDIEYSFDVQMDITAEAVQADGFDSADDAFAATFDK